MLTIHANIPLDVAPLTTADQKAPNDADRASTLSALRALNLIGSRVRIDHSESQPNAQTLELRRLEAKVDLLVAMVGSLAVGLAPLPPAADVALSNEGIVTRWQPRQRPDSMVIVTLYPSREIPRPVKFHARVVHTTDLGAAEFGVRLEFTAMDHAMAEEWERYLFLQHRLELSKHATL